MKFEQNIYNELIKYETSNTYIERLQEEDLVCEIEGVFDQTYTINEKAFKMCKEYAQKHAYGTMFYNTDLMNFSKDQTIYSIHCKPMEESMAEALSFVLKEENQDENLDPSYFKAAFFLVQEDDFLIGMLFNPHYNPCESYLGYIAREKQESIEEYNPLNYRNITTTTQRAEWEVPQIDEQGYIVEDK